MSITNLYSIKDLTAQLFHNPFYARNNASAIRTFADAVKDERSDFNKHPEDYVLYHVGSFSDHDGTITPEPACNELVTATQVLEQELAPLHDSNVDQAQLSVRSADTKQAHPLVLETDPKNFNS